MLRQIVTGVLVVGAVAGGVQAAETYQIDSGHSHIGFAVRHFGVSNVRGEFKDFAADLTIAEADLGASSVDLTIEAASIFTDHEQRDKHLRSADFLDVESHPQLRFTSSSIERTGDGTFMVKGDLAIRGVTRQVEVPVSLAGPLMDPLGMMRIGVEGAVIIDRQDYGVSWSRVMDNGGLFVGDKVKISFSMEATRPVEKAEAESGSEG